MRNRKSSMLLSLTTKSWCVKQAQKVWKNDFQALYKTNFLCLEWWLPFCSYVNCKLFKEERGQVSALDFTVLLHLWSRKCKIRRRLEVMSKNRSQELGMIVRGQSRCIFILMSPIVRHICLLKQWMFFVCLFYVCFVLAFWERRIWSLSWNQLL